MDHKLDKDYLDQLISEKKALGYNEKSSSRGNFTYIESKIELFT